MNRRLDQELENNDGELERVAGNGNSCGLQSSVAWVSEAGEEYCILAFGDDSGNFFLKVEGEALPLPEKDICENEEALEFETLSADEPFVVLSLLPTCVEDYGIFVEALEATFTKIINISVPLMGSFNDLLFEKKNCYNIFPEGIDKERRGVWYQLMGSGETVHACVESCTASALFVNGNCTDPQCALSFEGSAYFTTLGEIYWIFVGQYVKDWNMVTGNERLIVVEG